MRRHTLPIVHVALLALTAALTLSTSSKATPIPAGDTIDLQFTASAAGNIITFVNPGTSFAATGSLSPLGCSACVTITSPLDISQTNPTLDITLAAATETGTFTATGPFLAATIATFIAITDTGIFDLPGFDPTNAELALNVNTSVRGASGTLTSDGTAAQITQPIAVPEPPSSTLLFGLGVLAVIALRYWRPASRTA
jgi:hypothetical protein